MGFTILRATTDVLRENPEVEELVVGLYQNRFDGDDPLPGEGAQFSYDEFSQDELDRLFGAMAKSNGPIGVYVDTDPVECGDFLIFSIFRLAAHMAKNRPVEFPSNTSRPSPAQELAATIHEISKNPAGGYPIVQIWW